ncbi:polysaccharide biosynthesis/export family protein [Frigidibacter sp. MR17.14]|uniref:polysaccharide biosynthesis/export family protein n=1 Tax=Frigidibacter sp. MR17.14 TaxID=3126509 RepID=UPI0030131DE0
MQSRRLPRLSGTVAVLALLVPGCAPERRADNLGVSPAQGGYQAQYRLPEARRAEGAPALRSVAMNAAACRPPAGGEGRARHASGALQGEVLSRGDLIDIRLVDDTTFSHAYEVSRDGTVKLPFLGAVPAAGRSAAALEQTIASRLVDRGFYPHAPDVSVLMTDFGSARVAVSGAVFQPQTVELGLRGDSVDGSRQEAFGGSTEGRNLSVALRQAGGIRPDADLSAVQLRRAGASFTVDLRGAVDGTAFDDVMLIAGDEVTVPSRGCFQDGLMVPSPVSPPGISLFLSNLTVPAGANAPSAISNESRQVPYGTRFLQATINANCVGGALATSAARSAALVSRDPVTKVSSVVERRLENLMTRADRDDYDPYLLPGDAIACYDSSVTNIADIARVLGGITSTASGF